MRYQLSKILFGLFVLTMTACGTFQGASTNSEGDQNIVFESTELTFDASVPENTFGSFPLRNNTAGALVITDIRFQNNLCGSFSLYNITSETGSILQTPSSSIHVRVLPSQQVRVNIRHVPANCQYKNYETILTIYTTDEQGLIETSNILLRSKGSPPSTGAADIICDEEPSNVTYEKQFLSKIPDAGTYYLRVDLIRAFIVPSASRTDNSVVIGSDIGGLTPDDFESPNLLIDVSEKTSTEVDGKETVTANFVLKEITPCDDFILPSPNSDIYFEGIDTLLTSTGPVNGKFTQVIDPVNQTKDVQIALETPITVNLRAEGPFQDSLVQKDNTFEISVEADLTTLEAKPGEPSFVDLLESRNNYFDGFFRDQFLNENGDFNIRGVPFRDGRAVLVGRGTFNNDQNNFIGSDAASKFLLEGEAYLYMQLDITLTTRIEGGNQ